MALSYTDGPMWNSTAEQTMDGKEGQSITLVCSVCGYPTPQLTHTRWFLNKSVLSHNKMRQDGYQLTISNVTKMDYGQYTCSILQAPKGRWINFTLYLRQKEVDTGGIFNPIIIFQFNSIQYFIFPIIKPK